jgi:hypothetical protein
VPVVFRGHRWTLPVGFDGSFDAVLPEAPAGDGRLRVAAATITPVYSLPAGPLPRRGVSVHEAGELLYLMLHADDPGLVKAGTRGLPVAHKIGRLDDSRGDVSIVFGRRGPTVVTVYCFGDIDDSANGFGPAVARVATRGG